MCVYVVCVFCVVVDEGRTAGSGKEAATAAGLRRRWRRKTEAVEEMMGRVMPERERLQRCCVGGGSVVVAGVRRWFD